MTGCRATRRALVVAEGRQASPRAATHMRECLGCQAEAARIRTYHRRLRTYADTEMRAPWWMLERVMGLLDTAPGTTRRRPAEWLAATGAALVLAGAVAVVGRRRLRGSIA